MESLVEVVPPGRPPGAFVPFLPRVGAVSPDSPNGEDDEPFVVFAGREPSPPVVKVLVAGIGGDGCGVVDQMHARNTNGVDFIALDTDYTSLQRVQIEAKLLLGKQATRMIGTGGRPKLGKSAALEVSEKWEQLVSDYGIVLIVASMGGGTGAGASAHLARLAKQAGALTVAVVSSPFEYEGRHKAENAALGVAELKNSADSIIVIPNDRLFSQDNRITYLDALKLRDQLLAGVVTSVTDLVFLPAEVRIDFGSIRTVIEDGGSMVVAKASASGGNKVDTLVEDLLSNTLGGGQSLERAQALLLVATIAYDVTAYEGLRIKSRITSKVSQDAKIFCTTRLVEKPADTICATLIATHFDEPMANRANLMRFDKIFTIEEINNASLTHSIHIPSYKRLRKDSDEAK